MINRQTHRRGLRPLALTLFLALVLAACASQNDAAQPGQLNVVEDAGDGTETATGGEPAVPAPDLALDEEPAEVADIEVELEETGFLEVAAEPDLEILAQDNCDSLVDTVLGQYQTLLDELGDASRTDTRAIDEAFESPVMDGRLISRRADEVGCDPDRITSGVCPAIGDLETGGQVARDIVGILDSRCNQF